MCRLNKLKLSSNKPKSRAFQGAMLVQLVGKPRNVHKMWCINHSESDFQTVSRLNFLDRHNMNCHSTLFKLEFIGWFDSYIFLQAEPFILKDADLKNNHHSIDVFSLYQRLFLFEFMFPQQMHVSTLGFTEGAHKMQENIIGPMGATLSDSLECPADGYQGFTMVSEGFNFLVLWDVYLLKQTICWLLDLKVFWKNHMKCFLNMFWAVKRYDGSFFCHKRCASYFGFNYAMLINVACLVVFPLLLLLSKLLLVVKFWNEFRHRFV